MEELIIVEIEEAIESVKIKEKQNQEDVHYASINAFESIANTLCSYDTHEVSDSL